MSIGLCLHWSLDNYKQFVDKQPISGERLICEYEIKTYLKIMDGLVLIKEDLSCLVSASSVWN